MAENKVLEQIRTRDLVPTIATIARGLGWRVIELHGNRTNPGESSLPDLQLLRGKQGRVVKALGLKQQLSARQEMFMAEFLEVGLEPLVYRPNDFVQIVEDLK